MPAVEAQQPEVQQMELPSMNGPITEQPVRLPPNFQFYRNGNTNTFAQRQNEGMSADPVSMRGGGLLYVFSLSSH